MMSGSNANINIGLYKRVYILIMGILLGAVIAMPLFVRGGLALSGRIVIEEELLEMILIAVLLAVAFLISRKYEHKLIENQKRIDQLASEQRQLTSSLSEAFHYIGTVNVEVSELQNLFCDLDRYPQSKNDFKNLLCILGDKAMVLTRSDWAIIRIIGLEQLRTLKECRRGRISEETSAMRISNRAITDEEKIDGYCIIASRQRSPYFKTVCITGECDLPTEARRMVEAITGIAEMLFLIFSRQCEKRD